MCLSLCSCVIIFGALALIKSLKLRVTTGSRGWSSTEGFSQLLLCVWMCHVGKRLFTIFWNSIPVNWASRDSWEQSYIAWHINIFRVSVTYCYWDSTFIYISVGTLTCINSVGLVDTQNLIGSGPSAEDIAQPLSCPFLYTFHSTLSVNIV